MIPRRTALSRSLFAAFPQRPLHHLALSTLVLAFAAAGASTARAQDTSAEPESTEQTSANGEVMTLPAIVVERDQDNAVQGFVAKRGSTASKTDTPLIEVPQSISVVTRDQLDVRDVDSDQEALRYTPGVVAEPFGSHSTGFFNRFFILRGFSSQNGGDYLDGMRVPDFYGRFEPYGYERIDVLRGPSSVLYGQMDPGGVVNRVSKLPTDEAFGEVALEVGTFDHREAKFDLGGPLDADGEFLFRLTGLYRDANVATDYDFGQEVPNDRRFLAPSLTWKPSEDTSLTILASYLRDDGEEGNTYTTPEGKPTRFALRENGFNNFEHEQYSLGYFLEHRFNDTFQFRQRVRSLYYEVDHVTLYSPYWEPPIDANTIATYSEGYPEVQRTLTMDNQLQADFEAGGMEHTALFGVDYRNKVRHIEWTGGTGPNFDLNNPDYNQGVATVGDIWRDRRYHTRQIGVYAQDQAKLDDNWVFTLGGRYDWAESETDDIIRLTHSESDDQAFTWRGGVTYLFDSGLAPYFSYSESFLPTEADFEPTEGQQFEVGLKYQPTGQNVIYTVSVYDLTQQNILTPDPNDPTGATLIQTGEVKSQGIELEATGSLAKGLDFTLAYAFNDTEITEANDGTEGNRLARAPRNIASAWVDYTVQGGPAAGLGMGLGVRYIGDAYADNGNTIENESYTLLDASARYDLGRLDESLDGVNVQLNVNNLLDEEYSTCIDSFNCAYGEERTITAQVSYNW